MEFGAWELLLFDMVVSIVCRHFQLVVEQLPCQHFHDCISRACGVGKAYNAVP